MIAISRFNLIFTCSTLVLTSMSQLAYADNEAQAAYPLLNSVKAGKPLTSFRLRYENVNQDGLRPAGTLAANKELSNGEGLTLRSLIGWQTAAYQNFSLGAQVIHVTKFIDNFNDSTNNTRINAGSNQLSNVEYAKIVDPDYTGVNQLYLDWTGIKNTKFRLGAATSKFR